MNIPPLAENDAYAVDEDAALTEAAPGVLANDTDVDGDPLTALLVSDVSSGSLTLNLDGSFSYTPDSDFGGVDAFTYVANDGTDDSDTGLVSITVTPVNDPPVATEDAASTDEDVPVTIDVLANDCDIDGDPLTVSAVTDPSNGTAVINSDNTITYTPDPNFNGADAFDYTIRDGNGGKGSVMVSVTVIPVDDPPTVQLSLAEQTVQYSDYIQPVVVTATDVDSHPLDLNLSVGLGTVSGGCTQVDPGTSCE